ncbi:FecCD family ABC transporter permease [Methermicoccus shengliensis]|uniref:Cobalamin import system permease protein BtuC n=1 Tax=Methermicoccus shengliensis TaxID=660064 RepID=A0A832VWU3_9EURY|nr:iron ABC transporter permease [Methermicoccus shengliensis]KUK05125.1 MAG: Iron (III) ABC transporter, permease protein (HemU-1) [Euryarchaeota archaeon 55_53]KUK30691.1 MAG: Iron (III) ABC transporter, permease protein (HemU-1) [Methanosarcinales archeaon 56_1174]MDI3487285.1 iron complex transport system permease protein [Methanosarcinales archaeon]MDN5294640.1 iron complex transport system permease protein [Methanosarcinales archaeon]HIH69347.1 iron ABC transporter permease [Methermicocc
MSVAGDYRKELQRRVSFSIFVLIFLLLITFVALNLGSYQMSLEEILRGFLSGDAVLWNVRIPRIATSLLVGASLAIGGAVLQCVLKNPLASPYTLGITHGSAFGASIAIVFFGAGLTHRVGEGVTITNPYLVPLFAFAGAMITATVILLLARLRNLSPVAIILAGVAMSSLFQAGVMLIQYFATDIQVAAIVFWTFGDVGRASWSEIYIIFAIFVVCFLYFFHRRWDYNSLLLGDETAKSLGGEVQRIRLEGLILTSLLTATCVSFTGIIGFVGLVAPHMVRLMIGGDYRFLIPSSTILGALILLASDTVGRTVIAPVIIPVGIITSLLGAPMFIYLLLREGGGYD